MVPAALKAAEELAKAKASAEVVDPRTLAPLDIDAVLAIGAPGSAGCWWWIGLRALRRGRESPPRSWSAPSTTSTAACSA